MSKDKKTKDIKKSEKKKEIKKEKKVGLFGKIGNYFHEIKLELKKVKWPTKQEFFKYTMATLFFIIFFALFFLLSDVVIYGLKQLVR
jgi:preprotein translocase subunit SecE